MIAYGKGKRGHSKAREATTYYVQHPEEFGDDVHARTACMEKFGIEETQRSNFNSAVREFRRATMGSSAVPTPRSGSSASSATAASSAAGSAAPTPA